MTPSPEFSMDNEALTIIRNMIQDTIDEILSPRSTATARTAGLRRLERRLADSVQDTDSQMLDSFVALQHTFECNIPSRLLPWISAATQQLNEDQVVSQLTVAMSLLQGIAMLHDPTKRSLGRKFSLEIIIDLLLESRHVPQASENLPLTSVVLDALLCILVDSPVALRVFEASNGVQAIVKILKRAGTPREVRMKCLEFIYFYLLDESPTACLATAPSTPTPSVPSTPMRGSKKPSINPTPNRPMARYGSGSSFSQDGVSSRSTSSSSARSSSSGSTAPSSVGSPRNSVFTTSPPTSPHSHSHPAQPQSRSLRMLKKELDFVPQSPQKRSRHMPSKSLGNIQVPNRPSTSSLTPGATTMRLGSAFTLDSDKDKENGKGLGKSLFALDVVGASPKKVKGTRTTEEKKEILGTMLGNVDALVEGVRRAGIWGLDT